MALSDNDDYYDEEDDQIYEEEDDDLKKIYEEDDLKKIFDEVEDEDKDEKQEPHYQFTVLRESDIRDQQKADIAAVAATYSVSESAASLLLRHFRWIRSKLDDAWLLDESAVRRAVGLSGDDLNRPNLNGNSAICGICFENFPRESLHSAICGHPFCADCWGGYIGTAVAGGGSCLSLRCPEPSCAAAIDEDMISKLAPTEEAKEKYYHYLVRSYIEENNKYTKWCPSPGCDNAVKFVHFTRDVGGFDVKCLCNSMFCWNCLEEAHQPVDCETVKNWILKNSAESENVTYLLAYTKPCPGCKKPIEKNSGCNHMSCRCGFQFCWICLEDWTAHGRSYACNKYHPEIGDVRKRAKMSLERYTHYYERWDNNHKSRIKAMSDLEEMKNVHIEKIKKVQLCPEEAKIDFIREAWEQIVECRRVLKWTYAYGFYHILEEEKKKKAFFEYIQGEAENGLEKLHSFTERELKRFLEAKGPLDTFNSFRSELTGLTNVTKTYFNSLVRALQNGLSEVGFHEHEASSSSNSSKARGEGEIPYNPNYDVVDVDDLAYWDCAQCTFANPSTIAHCSMCGNLDASHWLCRSCTFANAGTAMNCQACYLRRSDHWCCASCTFANALRFTECQVCREPRGSS